MECLLHASGDILHLCRRGEAYREPAARPLSPMDAAWAIEAIPADALGLKADLLRVLEHLQAYFGCTPRTTVAELRTAVVRAIRDGGLVVYRARPPILSGSVVAVAQLPPKETYQEEQPLDMYVIAPELSFLGAGVTPLIQHQVRVLDPETGEVVVDWRTTDDKGVIRAEVPENKSYRIEMMDLDLPLHRPPMPEEPPLAVLFCLFVDESGAPITGEDVVVTHPDGHDWHYSTDDDGRLDVSCRLGHYTLKIRDQELDAHAVLPRDRASEENAYRFVLASDADHGPADDPLNRLERYDLEPSAEDFLA